MTVTETDKAELERVAQGLTPRLEDVPTQAAILSRMGGSTSMVLADPSLARSI